MRSNAHRTGFFAATSSLLLSARAQTQNGCCVTLTYPVGGETFNNIDTVIVDYSTNYPDTNLTLWCNNPGTYETWNVDSSGTFKFSHFTSDVTIDTYPATCHLEFDNIQDLSNNYISPDFTLTDITGVSVMTYSTAPPSTNTAAAVITTTGSGTKETITSTPGSNSLSFTPVTSTHSSISTANDIAATGASGTGKVAAASSSASPSPSSSGLSTGAKAGIAVAAVVIVLGLIGGIVYLLAMKKRLRRAEAEATAAKEPPMYQGGGAQSHGAPSVSSVGNTSSWAPPPVPFQQQQPQMAEAYSNDKQSLAPTTTTTSMYGANTNPYGGSDAMKSPGGYSNMTSSGVSAYGGSNNGNADGMKATMGYTSGPGYDAPVELGADEVVHGRGHHELA